MNNMRATGIAFIVLGVIALAFPITTGMTINFFFGVVLALAGVAYLLGGYRAEAIRNRWGHLGLAAVFALVGIFLVFVPQLGAALFTLLLALVFIVQGGVMIYTGIFSGGTRRYFLAGAGAVGLIAGLLLIGNWPTSGKWIVGFLAGVNLIVIGVAMLNMRVELGSVRPTTPPPEDDVVDVEVITIEPSKPETTGSDDKQS